MACTVELETKVHTKVLVGAFFVIVKTDGLFAALLSTHAELEAADADARGCSGARQPDEVT